MLLTRRWRVFILAGSATLLVFALGYWLQPVRYRVYGLYSPHRLERRGGSQPSIPQEVTPNFLVRLSEMLTFRAGQLSPEAKFIRNDDLLQDVIEQLQIKDFGGNPASPRSLRRRIILSPADQAATVKIALYDSDPEFAKQIVNRLMESYVDYFSAQTPEETVSFRSVIQPHLVNAQTLSRQTQQALYQIQVGASQAALDTSIRSGDQTLELQAIGISTQQQLSTIDADLAQLRGFLDEAVDGQRNLVQQVIKLGEMRKNLLIKLQDALNQPRDSETLSAALQELETQGLSLKTELTVTQTQYAKLLEDQQAPWAVARAAQQSAAIIQSADLPTRGTRPFLPWFLGAGILSAGVVGALASYWRERQDQSLTSLAHIYAQMQLPILGILPVFSSQNFSIQSLARQDGTEFQEFPQVMSGYHQMIEHLSLTSLDRIPQVLAFTSIARGEGKSLTVANLAYLLAKAGKKVILLDADIFHPSQFQLWDVAQSAGLCDCLSGEIQLGKALQRLHPNLDLLQSGYPTKNKDILLNSPGLSLFMQEFRTRYDHILVDTPALDVSVHGYLLANTADATILVLRPDYVDRIDIARLRETLGRSGTKLWGMVINGAKQSPHAFGVATLIRESQWDATLRLQKQKKMTGLELSTLSAINPPEESVPQTVERLQDATDAHRRQQQEDYLYQLPLDEVKKLVDVLWEDWNHDIEMLLEQEEEVVQQSRLVKEFQTQVEHGNPYLKLTSELQLKEEKEKLTVLAEAYVGQRSALMAEKEDLKFYLSILFARTDAENILPTQSMIGSSQAEE